MLSLPEDLNKAQDGTLLRSKVSERSIGLSIFSEDDKRALVPSTNRKPWKPVTQKAYFLVPTILASAALVAVLQVYLMRSERDSGILFASKINDLPLGQRFPYLYLPTIVSLVLSFAWTWIDLDVKRLQPYVQLSKPQGALGKDSILLHYPFDFVALVPFAAVKRQHWPVFSASLAVVIIFWVITPLQSSIFATKTTHKTIQVATASSTSHLSLQEQKTTLTGSYAQSVYNIAWLNETMPPFMNRNGMLAPFGPIGNIDKIHTAETWTAPTQLYSVDVNCEIPTSDRDKYSTYYHSSYGCTYDSGNMNLPEGIGPDQYASLYVGYWYEESMDSYLKGLCPVQANQTFLIRFSRGQKEGTGDDLTGLSPYPIEGTILWCNSSYYQQEVNATVSPPSMNVVEVIPTGPKRPLPIDLFNVTDFERGMSEGYEAYVNRGDYPTSGWPSPYDRLCAEYPKLYWDYYLANMATFPLATYQRPLEDYLDAEILRGSYEAAYRLLFARRLADVLSSKLDHNTQALGIRQYSTQTVVMVPIFVYVIEGLIVVTALAAAVVLALSLLAKVKLTSEPANIASLMALSGPDSCIVQQMCGDDRATSGQLKAKYQETRFKLSDTGPNQDVAICCLEPHNQANYPLISSKPILPIEFSWYFGVSFLSLQIGLVVVLVYFFVRMRREEGLQLPSTSIFVNQLLENYLPMVIGAFFEPIFTMLTRTLCMLEPYDQLRRGHEKAGRSITLDYSSVPPQAVVFRAVKAGHIPLALVSLMTLLANVLSVAFSALSYEDLVMLSTPANFTSVYKFPLNGSSLGNESISRNRPSYDQYYVAMSNLTVGTPLPAWTDDAFFYVPFQIPKSQNDSNTRYKATTAAVGASLRCFPMQQRSDGHNLTWIALDGNPSCNMSSLPNYANVQSQQPNAIEYPNFFMSGRADTCELKVLAGWGRSSFSTEAPLNGSLVYSDGPLVASWVGCKPELLVESREVVVDGEGIVQSSHAMNSSFTKEDQFFEPSASSLINSFHGLLDPARGLRFSNMVTPTWHNDTFPSDFISYLMEHMTNSTKFLDPSLPPPSFKDTAPLLKAIYAKLFAIALGTNVQKILRSSEESTIVTGVSMVPETRVFISEPMFIVSIVILAVFILVTMVLYVRRPWRILPRMPTTIASQIAFFAASHALQDIPGTSSMSEKERNSYVRGLRQRYGFGRFVGTDGKTHIGIEREPLVQTLTREDLH